jgi:ring-1,2-phenylacetyl-CoA epoxidase subunit PaaD
MVAADLLRLALEEVKDPEIPPLSVVDLGIIEDVRVEEGRVVVEAIPTFVGCPALEIIRRDITERLLQVEGVESVAVKFLLSPPWTTDRITEKGRAMLRSFGIAPPGRSGGGDLIVLEEAPACPYCGSGKTHLENLFGPTACRSIYYCDACRQPFEAMKQI